MNQASDRSNAERTRDSVVLADVFAALWKSKWLISACAVGGILLGIALSVLSAKTYKAVIQMVPAGESAAGTGGVAARLGGIANLVGLDGLGDVGGRKVEALAVLQSNALTMKYIEDNNLLPVLFSDHWDADTGKWKSSGVRKPTLWEGARIFAKHRAVGESASTGVIQMVITWTDAEMAARWANDLVRLTDDRLRKDAIGRSERNIAYLNEEVAKSSVVEMRTSIYALIQQEMKALMLARGNDVFALKVVDPAVPPEIPANPGLLVWMILGAIVGFGAGALVVLVRFGLHG